MTSLVDPYSRRIDYLRLAVTDRCNLRCDYCMPPQGVPHLEHEEILTYEEIVRFLEISVQAGISKVRLTGGEPLVRKDLDYLVREISGLRPTLDISLTTNGTLLSRHAEALSSAGLKRVNVSIDSLDPDTYRRITRTGSLCDALDGVEAALDAGLDPVKINVVVLKHLGDELEGFVDLVNRLPVHVRFIEYMSPCGVFDKSYYVSAEDIKTGAAGFRIRQGLGAAGRSGAGPLLPSSGSQGLDGIYIPGELPFLPQLQPPPPDRRRQDETLSFFRRGNGYEGDAEE
jgi:cyclic pyranopterin phosphate synthase